MSKGKSTSRSAKSAGSILQALQAANRKSAARSHLTKKQQATSTSQMSLNNPPTELNASAISPPDPTVIAMENLSAHFESLLTKALDSLATRITAELTQLGDRTSDIEQRLDTMDISMSRYDQQIADLKDENLHLTLKMEDLENRSRRSNLRIRGIPESVLDVSATVTALFQELLPSLPIDRLKFDRAHRALARRNPAGPPRDIVVKLHFYRSRDLLLQASRERARSAPLVFQNHPYQLFADIAPSTIARRRELKPLLEILSNHQIPYKWGFPFRLLFTYKGQRHSSSSFAELMKVLQQLGLSTAGTTRPHPGPNATKSPDKKKARLSSSRQSLTTPSRSTEDTMD